MVAGVSRARFCPGPGRQPRLEALDVGAADVARPVAARGVRRPGRSRTSAARGRRRSRCPGAARTRSGPGRRASWPPPAGGWPRGRAQVGSSSGPLTAASGTPGSALGCGRCVRRRAGRVGCAGEDLGVDDLGGAAVLRGQPVIGQVQVDPGRLDRGVPGLGLDRLQRHPRLPQPGQAGVPQLVAGRMRQPGPGAGAVEDLVDPVRGQRLAPPGPFEHQEHARRCRRRRGAPAPGRPPGARRTAAEIGTSRWWPPLPSAMNTRRSRRADVTQSQPEDLAAAQPAQHHRGDHRPVPVGAQRSGQGVDLGRGQDPRQASGAGPAPTAPPDRAGAVPGGSAAHAGPGCVGTSPRAVRNAYNPLIVDSRRRTVRERHPGRVIAGTGRARRLGQATARRCAGR